MSPLQDIQMAVQSCYSTSQLTPGTGWMLLTGPLHYFQVTVPRRNFAQSVPEIPIAQHFRGFLEPYFGAPDGGCCVLKVRCGIARPPASAVGLAEGVARPRYVPVLALPDKGQDLGCQDAVRQVIEEGGRWRKEAEGADGPSS